jgi:FXSXX-COOH protein
VTSPATNLMTDLADVSGLSLTELRSCTEPALRASIHRLTARTVEAHDLVLENNRTMPST